MKIEQDNAEKGCVRARGPHGMVNDLILNEKRIRLPNLTMHMNTNELSNSKLKLLSALAVLIIALLCLNGSKGHAQSAPATQSPQLQEVVKLTQAKMTDDVILAYIKNSGAAFNLTADDILYLNSQGVSQPVISALLQSKTSAPAPAPAYAPVAAPSTPAPTVAAAQPPPYSAPGQVSPYPTAAAPYPAPAPEVAAPSEPPPGSEVTLPYFQAQLAPYGAWVDIPGYGPGWVPSVQGTVPDWRPYFNGGHWVYTDDGNFWQSDYPWGEYTFHYGRWMKDIRYGWVWIPGYNWAPAWVSWRHAEGEGFCGWAPLGPDVRFEAGVGLMWRGRVAVDVDFGIAPDLYVFVPFDHFWAHDYLGFRAPFWRVPLLFRGSVLDNHFVFAGGRFVFGGIGRERLAVFTHHDIRVERVEFHDAHLAHAREVEHAHITERHEIDHSRAVGRPGEGHEAGRSGPGGSRDHDNGGH